MAGRSSAQVVPTDVALRALAISSVVVNHSLRLVDDVPAWLRRIGRESGPMLWEPRYLWGHVPHMQVWNFALGCVIYLVRREPQRERPWVNPTFATLCVVLATAVAYSPDRLQFWWLIGGGALLIMKREVRLSRFLAPLVLVVSSATFTIYRTHEFWFRVSRDVYRVIGPGHEPHPSLVFVAGLTMGVISWVVSTSFVRTYRRFRPVAGRLRLGPPALQRA